MRPSLARVVGIVGAGNTAVDAARVARRLGAEEAILIYRSDRKHMRAHPEEARRLSPKGVRSNGCRR
jgi:NADPH-dependent glutamate synthase beta subunit-like oxidoreductase